MGTNNKLSNHFRVYKILFMTIFIVSSFFWLPDSGIPRITSAGETSTHSLIARLKRPNYSPLNPFSIFQHYILRHLPHGQGVDLGILQGGGLSPFEVKWGINIEEAVLFTPVINAAGSVGYVVANVLEETESGEPRGRLYAINLADGGIRWQFDVQGGVIVAGPTVAADGTIYLLANMDDPETGIAHGVLFAIDRNGVQRWSFMVDEAIFAPLVLGPDGRIFFGTTFIGTNETISGFLYAVNPFSVTDQAAVTPDWVFRTRGGIVSSPIVTERGTVFVGTAEDVDGGRIYAIGSEQGNLKWEFRTDGPVITPPIRKDNMVFASISNVNPIVNIKEEPGQQFTLTGKILAFDTDSVDPKNVIPSWVTPLDGGVIFPPLIINDTLYVGTIEVLISLPEDLEEIEDVDDIKEIIEDMQPPNGSLLAIDTANGVVRRDVDLGGVAASSPVAGPEGSILIGAGQINLQEANRQQRPLTGILRAFDTDLTEKWRVNIKDGSIFSAPVIDIDGVVYVGSGGFSVKGGLVGRLHAINFSSGKPAWDFKAKGIILSSPVIDVNDLTDEKAVYFGTGDVSEDLETGDLVISGVIYGINVERGRIERAPSVITVDEIIPRVATLGDPIEVTGEITPAPRNAASVMVIISDSLGRVFEKKTFTNPDSGRYTLSGLFLPGGSWEVTARWDGDSNLLGAVSDPPISLQINKADTALTMEVSATEIKARETLEVTGRISPRPDNPFVRDLLVGSPIKLVRIGPNNEVEVLFANAEISGETVQYRFADVSLLQPGKWQLLASFGENNPNFNKSNLEDQAVTVIPSDKALPGYAIIVEGRVGSEKGLENHNLTTTKIHQQMLRRGFDDENIFYLNFDSTQDGVDGTPTKRNVLDAITAWAMARIKLSPASLYIVLVGHGEEDRFPLSPDILEAEDLAQAVSRLEEGLKGSAAPGNGTVDQKIVIILGAPHSGSFIGELSGEGRIIITSSDTREVSFKGPLAPTETLRNGDFFVSEFFKRAVSGLSLKSSYEGAALAAMSFTRNKDGNGLNGADAGNGSYEDDAAFHPLLDDNGDGIGSNGQLSATAGKDGALAANLILCGGLIKHPDPVEITHVLPHIILEPNVPDPLLKAQVSAVEKVDKIWVEIKPPDLKLTFDEASTEQKELDLRRFSGTLNPLEGRYEWPDLTGQGFDGFVQGGEYHVFYFVIDKQTGDNSPFDKETAQTTLVRNSDASNEPPKTFGLKFPADDGETSIVLAMSWEQTEDTDGGQGSASLSHEIGSTRQKIMQEVANTSKVTFTILVSQDETFNSVDFKLDGLIDNFALIDTIASLSFGKRYFWKVLAVDEKGAVRPSSSGRSFVTATSSGFPGFVKGFVSEKETGKRVFNATLRLPDRNAAFTTQEDGIYFFELPSGKYTIESETAGLKPQRAAINISSFETTARDFLLERFSSKPSLMSVSPTTAKKSKKMKEAIVTVMDQDDQPRPGVVVTASARGMGAKIRPASQITDVNGAAAFTFKFGGKKGKKGKITFSADGLSATITQQ